MASNYLFRMVERAAGLSPEQAPRPPQHFYWPLPWEQPAKAINSSLLASSNTSSARLVPATLPPFSRDLVEGESPLALNTASTEEANPVVTPAAHSHSQENFAFNGGSFAASSDAQPSVLSGTVDPARRFVHEESGSQPDTMVIEKPLAAAAKLQDPRFAIPTPQKISFRSNGEAASRGSMPQTPQETVEPVVEVNIARVEVHLDPPRQPSPQAVPAPVGFAEFESLRRYAAGPWPSRRR